MKKNRLRPNTYISNPTGGTPGLACATLAGKKTVLDQKPPLQREQVVGSSPMPKHGWCNFRLSDEEKEFTASLSYLTDVMYDTLKMCLTYLQTGAAAVMYDREGEGTFLFVMSEYEVYVLDENLPSGMVHFENLRADDICEDILGCYYADTIGWLNFANMNEHSKKEYEKYEKKRLLRFVRWLRKSENS